MTIGSLYNDLTVMGVFLIAGFLVYTFVKPLQRMFLPASLIGGVIMLIFGQQALGVITVPASLGGLSGTLINLVMAALVFGVTLNRERIRSYLDYSFVCQGVYAMQMAFGVALGAFMMTYWPGLPKGWGSFAIFSFNGGHGTATAAGKVFVDLGLPDNLTVGMVMATFGLIVAMTVGMAVVNLGIRLGWATFVKEPGKQPQWFYGGPLPEDQKKSVGATVTSSISINHLALQLGWLLLASFIGIELFNLIGRVFPPALVMPNMARSIVGALILWYGLRMLKLDVYVDMKTVNQVSGVCLELVVFCAMATLNLKFVADYIVPLLLFAGILTVITLAACMLGCRFFSKTQWFEKAMIMFGAATGTVGTGLALLRALDPHTQSSAGDAHGVWCALFCWNHIFTAMVPIWLVSGIGLTCGIGVAMFAACLFFAIAMNIRRKGVAAR